MAHRHVVCAAIELGVSGAVSRYPGTSKVPRERLPPVTSRIDSARRAKLQKGRYPNSCYGSPSLAGVVPVAFRCAQSDCPDGPAFRPKGPNICGQPRRSVGLHSSFVPGRRLSITLSNTGWRRSQ